MARSARRRLGLRSRTGRRLARWLAAAPPPWQLKYAGRDPLASCAGAWFPGTLYHVNARAPRADPPIGAALLVERCRRWCTELGGSAPVAQHAGAAVVAEESDHPRCQPVPEQGLPQAAALGQILQDQ